MAKVSPTTAGGGGVSGFDAQSGGCVIREITTWNGGLGKCTATDPLIRDSRGRSCGRVQEGGAGGGRGWGGQQGQAQGSVMYAVRLRVLSDSDTSACHRGHQLHLVTAAAGPSPRLQLRANSINS